jgi:hypothetical protein
MHNNEYQIYDYDRVEVQHIFEQGQFYQILTNYQLVT